MASTLLTILRQKESRSGAPGKTHAMPMMATSPWTTIACECPCGLGELIRIPRLGVLLHLRQAVEGFAAHAFRIFDQPQQPPIISIERHIGVNDVPCGIRLDPHLAVDPLTRQGSEAFIRLHAG